MKKNKSGSVRLARKKKRSQRALWIKGGVLAACVAMGGARTAFAEDFLFTNGAGNGNWDTALNWARLNTNPPQNAVPYGRTAQAFISGNTVTKTGGTIYLNTLSLQNAAVLNLVGGVNLFAYGIDGGQINLAPSGNQIGTVYLNEAVALTNTRVNFGATGASDMRFFANSSLTTNAATTLSGAIGTIGSYNFGDTATFTNNGTINSTRQGTTYISPTSFTNNGTVSGGSGTNLAFQGGGTMTNAAYGNISVSGGTFSTFGNTFTNANLAQIFITGSGIVQDTVFTNNGTMDVTGTLTTLGSGGFTNNGTLRIFNGTLQVGSAFTANTNLLLSNSALTISTGGSLLTSNSPLTVTTLTLNGGTISNSTINAATIKGDTATSLQNVNLSGTIDATNGAAAATLTKSSLTGGTLNIKSGTNDGATLYFSGSGADASTMDNMTVNFDATNGGDIGLQPGGKLTIGSGTVLQGRIGQIGFAYGPNSGSVLVNNGTISASGADDRCFIDPASFTNNGLLEAKNGADLSLCFGGVATNSATGTIRTSGGGGLTIFDNSFTNQGTVSITGSGMGVIGGNVANSGAIAASSFLIDMGTLTNTGTVSLTGGGMNVNGGSVANSGTMTISDSGFSIGNGTLTNAGNLSITNGNFRVVDGATATTGNLTLTNSYLDVSEGATLNLAGTGTLSPTNFNIFGTVSKVNTFKDGNFAIGDGVGVGFNASTNLANTKMNFSTTRNDHFIDSQPGAVVNIDANSTLSGGLGRIGGGAAPAGIFTNNGTINSTNTGRTSIQTESFTNNKTLQSSGELFFDRSITTNGASGSIVAGGSTGGYVTVNGGTFTNNGTMSITGVGSFTGGGLIVTNGATANVGKLTLNNSYIGISEGSTADFTGTGTLAPTFINVAGTVGSVNTIKNGSFTLVDNSNVGFNASTNLVNTQMAFSTTQNTHAIDAQAGSVVNIDANSTLSGGLQRIGGPGNYTAAGKFANNGTVNTTNTGTTYIETESFTNNKTLQSSGSLYFDRSATTNAVGATIAANGALGAIAVNGGSMANNGTISLVAGRTITLTNGAVLSGTGTINGNLLNSSGVVAPGNSPGTLLVNGNFRQNNLGTLLMELGGTQTGQYDFLDIAGTATLGGTLQLSQFSSYIPVVGDTFTIMNASGGITGFFSNVVSANSGYTYSASVVGTQVKVQVVSAAAPEPGTIVLLGTGLSCGLIGTWFMRCRQGAGAA